MQETLRPKQILKDISHRWPYVWQQVKQFRAGKGKDLPDWPDWCYLPIHAGVAIATQWLHDAKAYLRYSPAVITAAATWRVTQGVYRFDPDLYKSLTTQPMDDNLPCEALKRLPEWCVYVETIPSDADIHSGKPYIVGFWAHLDYDESPREELRFVFFWNVGYLMPIIIHLGDWTLEEGLQRFLEEEKKQAKKIGLELPDSVNDVSDVVPYVQLVLYLCADNADMPQIRHPNKRVRIGERKLILRWLPPIPVGVDDTEGPAVIHKVERGD